MNRLSKLLFSAALVMMAAGISLAVARPGSLGDGHDTAAPTAETSTTSGPSTTRSNGATSAPTSLATTTTTTGAGVTSSTVAGSATTVAPESTTSTTQGPGSGLGTSGAAQGSDTADGLAATGGESLLYAGVVLGVTGLAVRRRTADD